MNKLNCVEQLRARAKQNPRENVYFSRENSKWIPTSWNDYHEQVRKFASSLVAIGLNVDDKVAILGFNCLEWVVSAMGAQYASCVSVGVYASSSINEVSYVVSHSDAKILVVEDLKIYEKQVKPIRRDLSKVTHIVLMSNEKGTEKDVLGFNEFLKLGNTSHEKEVEERFQRLDSTKPATMIYTSGTTGNPKAVMLSHESIAWTINMAVQAWKCGPQDKAISYLPLAHVAEQFFSVYAPIECGVNCYFATSFEELRQNILEVEPTVFFGVPRVFEKMYDKLKTGIEEKSPLLKKVLAHFSKVANEYFAAVHCGEKPRSLNKIQYKFAQQYIFAKLRKKLGFANLRLCMSGAAPISKDILEFFCGLDIPIYEIYGQSESSGPATFNVADGARLGSVGRASPGGQIRLTDEGEIIIKGPHVFSGYYKDEVATKEVLKDGWLYTGDIGSIDKDGFLRITDRKKDILITAGGKNISPQNLEAMLKSLPFVQSAVVVGDAKKYLAALLSPDPERMSAKACELGIPKDQALSLVDNKIIHDEIKAELAKINQRLAPVEQIKRYSLLPYEFSIDSGEFTPTMKVKRKFVNEKYKKEIASLYS